MANKIQLRRDLASAWTGKTLVDGEIGIEFPDIPDAYPTRFKIGPGNWDDLPYSDLGIDNDGNLIVPNNLIISGNFTVNGTTNYIGASNTVITDNLLELHAPGGGVGGSWGTVDDGKDIGIRMHYSNGATDKNAALVLAHDTHNLEFYVDGNEDGNGIFGGTYGSIKALSFIGNVTGNVTGNADTVSNGVYTTGSYSNPSWITALAYSKLTGTVPTWNQNTTGSAAKWTTARNLAGNSVDGSTNVAFANKFIVQGTTDSGLTNAQFLGSLGTGIVKNTTSTGVLSIAVAGDFPTLNQNTTGYAAKIAGGANNQIVYQTGSNSTSFITAPSTADRYLHWTGSAFEWAAISSPTSLNTLTVSGTASLNGLTQIQQLDYPFTTKTGATGTVVHDCSVGQVFYHTSPAANFTANFTNLGLTTGYITKVELYIVQGYPARLPTVVQVAGSAKTINWYGAVNPTGHTNSLDLVTFTFLLSGTAYVVFGKVEQYDSVGGFGGN